MSSLMVEQTHPLQPNLNSYTLIKKMLSIHSEDRDITKWPNANDFQVELPVDYKNVVSMRLNDIEMPANFYVFSTENNNTKMSFTIVPTHTASSSSMGPMTFPYWDTVTYGTVSGATIAQTLLNNTTEYIITIESGTYTPCQLVDMINGLMNEAITKYLISEIPALPAEFTYDHMSIIYDPVSMKVWFGNNVDGFSLDFSKPEVYPVVCTTGSITTPYTIYSRYTHWGLGSYLGFGKEIYTAPAYSTAKNFYWNSTQPLWMNPTGSNPIYYMEAPTTLCIYGPGHIYMELATFNSIDETAPFNERTSNQFNARYGTVHNAAFAKIPVLGINNERWFTSKGFFLSNVFFSEPPLERIQKLHIRFRYHDGQLVDFAKCNLSLTIELNLMRPVIPRQRRVVIPPSYGD